MTKRVCSVCQKPRWARVAEFTCFTCKRKAKIAHTTARQKWFVRTKPRKPKFKKGHKR